MNFKCTGINVNEVIAPGGTEKVPMFTVTLEPVDGSGSTVRISGGAASFAATVAYGRLYTLAPAAEPSPAA